MAGERRESPSHWIIIEMLTIGEHCLNSCTVEKMLLMTLFLSSMQRNFRSFPLIWRNLTSHKEFRNSVISYILKSEIRPTFLTVWLGKYKTLHCPQESNICLFAHPVVRFSDWKVAVFTLIRTGCFYPTLLESVGGFRCLWLMTQSCMWRKV